MSPKLTKVLRLDSLPLGQTMFTDEGYLKDRPILTTIGIFEYVNPDGSIRRELRLPEEVFAEESLVSYKGKPIIITHDAGLIDKNNVQEEQIGTILSDGYRSGDDVRAEIIIHNTNEMKECGLKELSLGYNLDLDETPGVWNGQPYDAVQRNIRINHLALVREARAGEQARLNIDSRDSNTLKGGKAMAKSVKKNPKKAVRRADGVLSQEELTAAIEQYKARRAERMAANADEEDTTKVAPVEEKAAVDNGETVETAAETPTEVEEKVQLVKDRRDRRDSEGDPETTEEALGVIANQDEDMDILFDIIDTLLAEKAFDEADPEAKPAENADEGEDVPADEASATDEGEETPEDENAEEKFDGLDDVPAEDAPETDDGEETPAEESLDEDEEEPVAEPAESGKMNADAVDAIVRTRIQLGMLGRTLNMDGLENMSIMRAKKAVIHAVRPNLRLDGKSTAYINAAYDCAVADVNTRTRKDTGYQKNQMFNNRKGVRSDSKDSVSSAHSARQNMIARHMKEDK